MQIEIPANGDKIPFTKLVYWSIKPNGFRKTTMTENISIPLSTMETHALYVLLGNDTRATQNET